MWSAVAIVEAVGQLRRLLTRRWRQEAAEAGEAAAWPGLVLGLPLGLGLVMLPAWAHG